MEGGSSGVQREGRGSGMGDLWTTADKLTNNKREKGSRCQFLHWISLFAHFISRALIPWIQTGSSTSHQTHNIVCALSLTCRRVPVGLR